MTLALDFILKATDGKQIGSKNTASINSVCIDSRLCTKGSLFVCLAGEHSDGHNFAQAAVNQGCTAILASHNPFDGSEPPVPVILTEHTDIALRTLAKAWRNEYLKKHGRVICLTGTAGKTTTKEMLAQVLGRVGKVSYTPNNLNNNLGVPLSILNAELDALNWVIEAGISHEGDMEELGDMIRPDIALILNVGAGHSEGLGKRGTAYHKSQLLRFVQKDGQAFINADYPDLVRESLAICEQSGLNPTFFSTRTESKASYSAWYLGKKNQEYGRYLLRLDGKEIEVIAPFLGSFAAENIIAVASIAYSIGMNLESFAQTLKSITRPPMRFHKRTLGIWTIIDDSYNANPLSMKKMLEAAAEIETPLFCTLGAMYELGDVSQAEHETLGEALAKLKPQAIFWVGNYGESVSKGLKKEHSSIPLHIVKDTESFTQATVPYLCKGGVMLFKGSRANHLETFVETFCKKVQA